MVKVEGEVDMRSGALSGESFKRVPLASPLGHLAWLAAGSVAVHYLSQLVVELVLAG
jgi:hypothetical protein